MIIKPNIHVSDLTVASFRVPYVTDELKSWRDENQVFMAESCARQIWLGSADTFTTLPKEAIQNASQTLKFFNGSEAYKLLLKLSLGLLSKNTGETNFTGQFKDAWRSYRTSYPESSESFEKIIQHLTGDSRLIRNHVLDGWRMANHELCARDLSDMRHGNSVLIIGRDSPIGSISTVTDNIARKVTNNAGRSASEICITHPDPKIAAAFFRDLKIAKSNGTIPTEVSSLNFYDDLALAFEYYDRVYCTLPMGLNPDADDFIISCWQGKNEGNNTLTHLLGKQEIGTPIPENWTKAKLQNFVSPHDIDKEVKRRNEANKKLSEHAHSAIEHCTTLRLEARQASAKTLRDAGVPSSKPMPQEFVPLHSPQCG